MFLYLRAMWQSGILVFVAHSHESTETLPQNRKPVNFTMSAIPFEIWKAVQNEATNRQVSAKQIWIEAVVKYLGLEAKAA